MSLSSASGDRNGSGFKPLDLAQYEQISDSASPPSIGSSQKGQRHSSIPSSQQEPFAFFLPEEKQSHASTRDAFSEEEFFREKKEIAESDEYNLIVRKGAELYSEKLCKEADKKFAEAEKAKQEAESFLQKTQSEKKQILQEAALEAESTKQRAYQDGFEEGQASGMSQKFQELEPQVQNLFSLMEQLGSLREMIQIQSEQELVQLAVLIAKHIVFEELSINDSVLQNIVKQALRESEHHGKLTLFLHPTDYEFLIFFQADFERIIQNNQTLHLIPDPTITPGSFVIETDHSSVDFQMEQRFASIEKALSRKIMERQQRLQESSSD